MFSALTTYIKRVDIFDGSVDGGLGGHEAPTIFLILFALVHITLFILTTIAYMKKGGGFINERAAAFLSFGISWTFLDLFLTSSILYLLRKQKENGEGPRRLIDRTPLQTPDTA